MIRDRFRRCSELENLAEDSKEAIRRGENLLHSQQVLLGFIVSGGNNALTKSLVETNAPLKKSRLYERCIELYPNLRSPFPHTSKKVCFSTITNTSFAS